MNIAFPALFVFLLALPGIILRYAYREWAWKIPVYRLPLGEEIAKSFFSAAVLHLLGCLAAERFGYRVNFSDVLTLLTGGFGLPPEVLKQRLVAITRHPGAVAAYFSSLYAVAAGVGLMGHHLVRWLGLDLRIKALRFDNFWHYALNAEMPLFAENRADYAAILGISDKDLAAQDILTIVSCVVAHGTKSFVYYGFPIDYSFDRIGSLERIVIENVSYQELLTPEEELATRSTGGVIARSSIVADLFVLNASDIHNLAIQYVFGSSEGDENVASTEAAPPAEISSDGKP